MCTFSFEHNFIQLQLSFLSGIVKHQISCRGLKPNFQHNTIIKLIISTATFATILWNSPVFGNRFPPFFSNTPPSHSGNSSFHPSRVPWGQMLSHSHLNCSSQSLKNHLSFPSCSVCLWFPTSLVLLGSTTASQRDLAAAQAAELGGKEKALTGFLGFLASSWRAF